MTTAVVARPAVPSSTAIGTPITTTTATATKVMIKESMASDQKPKAPNDTNDAATRRAIRQPAMASPTQAATAVTPSQPTCGTGRGKSGMEIIRWAQSTTELNQSPRL